MAKPTEVHVQAAQRLLAQRSASGGSAQDHAAAVGSVYEALFQAFAPVVGAAGLRALIARSVRLSMADFPGLSEVLERADRQESGTPFGQELVAYLSKLEPKVASTAATGLYATFFALMTTFIGEALVWQIMQSAFPENDETV